MSVNYVRAIALTSKNATGFTGGYDVVNAGLSEACFLLRIINDSTKDITISYDGVTAHDYVTSGSQMEINAQANSSLPGKVALFKKGLPVYVLAAAGTGFVYVAGYYS